MSAPGRRCVVALLAAVAAAAVAPTAAAQAPATPSLRLFSAGDLRLSPAQARVAFQPGLWVAAVGGEFRLHVRRPDYRRWEVTQVDPVSGRALRSVPVRLLDGWDGLRRFVRLRIVDARGRVAARLSSNFCPGGFSAGERIDDSGPRRSSYATGCGAGSPFTQGMVWGIDAGWATPALMPGRGVRLRPGRYTAIATIATPYRRAFAIARRDAVARLRIRVTRGARDGAGRPGPEQPERATAARGTTPALAQADPATTPDLVALPAWNIVTRHRGDRDQLRFSSTAWNAGPAPLVVEGFRRPRRGVMDAFQYFHDADGNVVGRAPAGTMAFERHGGHDHWHFVQFATYRLIDERRRAIVRAGKQSFCLFPTDAVDLTVPRAALGFADPGIADGSLCGGSSSIWIRETLPVGWGDTYDRSVSGQAFDITSVPNGRYFVETRVNPDELLQETTLANNVQLRRIRLGGRRGARTVRVAPWNGIRR